VKKSGLSQAQAKALVDSQELSGSADVPAFFHIAAEPQPKKMAFHNSTC
jgi:hypothetical protein